MTQKMAEQLPSVTITSYRHLDSAPARVLTSEGLCTFSTRAQERARALNNLRVRHGSLLRLSYALEYWRGRDGRAEAFACLSRAADVRRAFAQEKAKDRE